MGVGFRVAKGDVIVEKGFERVEVVVYHFLRVVVWICRAFRRVIGKSFGRIVATIKWVFLYYVFRRVGSIKVMAN